MSDTGFLQQLATRFSGGFVVALHEIQPEQVADFVDTLRPAEIVPLSEVVDRIKKGKRTSGLYAITVDDGIGENVRALARLFMAKSWPATFYVPTQYLDTREGMSFQWWQRLKPLLPRRKLVLQSGDLDLTTPRAVEQLSKRMEALWHSGRTESYLPLTLELIKVVEQDLKTTKAALSPAPPITWEEVACLSRNDLIRFESHGVSHAAMSSLTDEELVFEMKHSRDRIAEHSGRPCRHLAYPFGSPHSIGNRAASAAKRFYDSAVTMTLGRVDSANPWLLPRIPLYPQNSRKFARLKVLLNCGLICSGSSQLNTPDPDLIRVPANPSGD